MNIYVLHAAGAFEPIHQGSYRECQKRRTEIKKSTCNPYEMVIERYEVWKEKDEAERARIDAVLDREEDEHQAYIDEHGEAPYVSPAESEFSWHCFYDDSCDDFIVVHSSNLEIALESLNSFLRAYKFSSPALTNAPYMCISDSADVDRLFPTALFLRCENLPCSADYTD